MLRFYSFRVNLIIPSDNLFTAVKPKEEHFQDLILNLKDKRKATFRDYRTKYILYYNSELIPNVHSLTLAREEITRNPVEGDIRIEEVETTRTPYVYVIIDHVRQLVLIQDKTTVFQEISISRARIESYLTRKLVTNFITASLQPITDKNDFWQEVSEVDSIKELDITVSAPNLFRGRQKAEDIVEEIYEDYNISEITIKLKNTLGQLKVLRENAEDWISLSAAGAGRYLLKGYKNGQDFVLKSYELIKKKTFPADIPEDIDRTELDSFLDRIDTLNDNGNS